MRHPAREPVCSLVTDRELLALTHEAASSLRTEHDAYRVEACLSFLDRLNRYGEETSAEYPAGTTRGWAALADFILETARDREWMWLWAAKTLIRCGYNPVAIVVEAATLQGSSDYGHAVARFDPDPNSYKLLDVNELPVPHTLHSCQHVRDEEREHRSRQQQQGRLARLIRTIRDVAPHERAASVQERVLAGSLPVCPKHRNVTGWDAINRYAEDIRANVRPWSERNVIAAAQAAPLRFEDQIALQSLYIDPITWDGKDHQVANGQHRLCGLRASGATHALVNLV